MPVNEDATPVHVAAGHTGGLGSGAGRPTVGILALQGGVAEHAVMLESLGARVVALRTKGALAASSLDGLVLPGGESSTVDRLLRRFEMREPLIEMLGQGLPVLGTCAGMILLAERIVDPAPEQQSLGVIPMAVRRNAFGRQLDSSTEDLESVFGQVRAAFIRAPQVMAIQDEVKVLARRGTAPDGDGPLVAAGTDHAIALSFHPELTGDPTFHREFLRNL